MTTPRLIIGTLVVVACCSSVAHSQQPPAIQWQKIVGECASNLATSIVNTNDGGFAVVGWTAYEVPCLPGLADAFISKLNATGQIEWQKRLGGSGSDQLEAIIQTRDGGYAAAGWSNSADGDASQGRGTLWVVKLDDTGRVQWGRRYGGSCGEIAFSIMQTSDGGFVAAGQTCSSDGDVKGYHKAVTVNGDTLDDAWIIRLDSAGNLQWQKCMGGSKVDGANSVVQTRDSGFLFVGGTQSADGDLPDTNTHRRSQTGEADVWIVKLDDTGSLLWQRTYGGSFGDDAYSVLNASNGGFTVFGQANSTDGDVECHGVNSWILHLDSLGELLWQECLSFPSETSGDVFPFATGGYIAAGSQATNYSGLPTGAWIAKYDSSDSLVWQKFIWGGGSGNDEASSAIEAPDGSIVFVGEADTRYQGGEVVGLDTTGDAWVVKLAPESSGVAEQPAATDIISYASSSPNPTGEGTIITFGISQEAYVKINLFDILGNPVSGGRVPGSGGEGFEGLFELGNHEVPLSLQGLPSGTYFARILTAYGNVATVKLVKE